ncbi:MAG: peroxiredoxin [Deltaproteobacteria bacterium]|nr:peroxiredoxin [Deltaproteobacteria bacterium]
MNHSCIKPVNVGQQVENFTMVTYLPTDYSFGEISLEQLKNEGKWTVLVFYPADFTFVCSTELSDFANLYDEFKAAGAEVITVSTDTQFTHLAWKREEKSLENARYIMGADPTGKISKMFGVYDEETGLALRGTFIISPAGLVVASEVNFYNVGRSAAETLRKLKASIYVAQHPEEACPANWREGDKTLTPSPDLVGKVFEALKK